MIAALLSACFLVGSDTATEASPPAVPAPAPPAPPPAPSVDPLDLRVAHDPDVVAPRLVAAERAIRDPAVDDATAAKWGHLQQRIYRAMAADDALAAKVTSRMPPELQDIVRRNLVGTGTIAKTVTTLRSDLPDWRIVESRPQSELLSYYKAAGEEYGVPWTALASINLNETRMGKLRGTSHVGAAGPMQFMPATWASYGTGDVTDDHDAIFGAANYLAKMGWARDPRKAIWAYNHSTHYIDAIQAFASVMDEDPLAYRGYWGWQVYYRTVKGSIWLEPGYESTERVAIDAYCGPRGEPHCPPSPGDL
ncbi:MAG: lytic transglycosylase domain-containing protein [Myxococcota bacterium]